MQLLRKCIVNLLKLLFPVVSGLLFLETVWNFYEGLTNFYYNGFILLTVLYSALVLIFMYMYGGTKIDTERVRNLALSNTIALLFANFFIYIIISLIALRFFNPLALIISMFIQAVMLTFLSFGSVHILRIIIPKANAIAIISDSNIDQDAVISIEKHDVKHKIVKTIIISELIDYQSVLEHCETVIIGDIEKHLRGDLLTYCYNSGKEVIIIPTMQDILLNNSSEYIVGDKLVYIDRYNGFNTLSEILKRVFDIVASIIGIIITSPIMLITAIMVKSYDGGPAFFKQKRLTKGGKEFNLIKFRSMIQNSEENAQTYLVLEGDKRITPVGKFIRATRIDELPQFFNILLGDMSFVGPRPERPELYEIYCRDCPEFRYRLKVKAGLTGYAQVYGKYNTTAKDKVKLDLLYIERASVLQDIQIILYTIKIIFMKESSEGVTDINKTAKKQ